MLMIKLQDLLKQSVNEITSSQAIEAGKDLIPIIKKWTAKDEDYLSFAYDKWQELLVKKYKIDPLVAIDIRNHLYSIHNRHNLDRLHNVAYGVIINLTESINESDNWKTVKTKSGDTLKPGKKYTMPRYDGEITFIRFDRDDKTMHLKSNKIGKIRTSIDNARGMELVESINEGWKTQGHRKGWKVNPKPNEDKEWSSYEQRMVNQIKAAKKEGMGMYTLPMKTQDFYRKHKDKFDEPINETKISRGIFKGYEKQKNKVLIPFISASDYNLTNSEMVNFTVGVGLELNKHIRFPHDDFYMWIINNKITALLTPRGKQRVEVNVEKGNYTFKDFISYFRSAVDTYINRTKNESINEDQFEASLPDPKKYKMGSMWFKRWFKPKKEQDGWTWEDDGQYIWLTRPKMKHPTVRFEKDTGLLQGNWKDPREMQWE